MRQQLITSLGLSPSEAEIEASWILEHVTNLNVTAQQRLLDDKLKDEQLQEIQDILNRRLNREPLQYILGKAYFFGLEFAVSSAVLIPRPETEELVNLALCLLNKDKPWSLVDKEIFEEEAPLWQANSADHFALNKTHESHSESKTAKPKILEIGTGSGCISVTLATKLPGASIIATDISEKCLQVARHNAAFHGVDHQISFLQADLVDECILHSSFDLLISNPPYIAESEFDTLQEEVKHEPLLALIGLNNADGLTYYKRIAQLKVQSELVLLEIDSARAQSIKQIFQQQGFSQTQILSDFNGFY